MKKEDYLSKGYILYSPFKGSSLKRLSGMHRSKFMGPQGYLLLHQVPTLKFPQFKFSTMPFHFTRFIPHCLPTSHLLTNSLFGLLLSSIIIIIYFSNLAPNLMACPSNVNLLLPVLHSKLSIPIFLLLPHFLPNPF